MTTGKATISKKTNADDIAVAAQCFAQCTDALSARDAARFEIKSIILNYCLADVS